MHPLGYVLCCYICLLFVFLNLFPKRNRSRLVVPELYIYLSLPFLSTNWQACITSLLLFPFKAIAGLAVSYGLNLNMLQAWVIWSICNMENKIISVERILQYMSIPSEPPLVIEENRPNSYWPSHGEVDIGNLQVGFHGLFN